MKNKIKLFVEVSIICLFLLKANHSLAQDLIIKKNNEKIKAKILEVGNTEIKYKLYDSPDGPTLTINKREVKTLKIEGKNGKNDYVMNIEEDPMSVGNSAIVGKTSSIKFHFFSPLDHKLAFTYEWMHRPGFNLETGLGIVGLGTGVLDRYKNSNPYGLYLRTGPKFLLGSSSDIEIEGARYAHPLKGRYFKIEMILYALSKNFTVPGQDSVSSGLGYYQTYRPEIKAQNSYFGMALNLIYGRQYIFGNSITIGWYAGLGYGFENKTTNYSSNNVRLPSPEDVDEADFGRYSHTYFGSKFPITWTGGFNIGYILKTPYWVSNIGKSKRKSKAPSRHSMDR